MKNVIIVKSDDMFDFCQVFANEYDAADSMKDRFGYCKNGFPEKGQSTENLIFEKQGIKHYFHAFWAEMA